MTIRSACTDTPADIGAASAYSRFVQRIRRRYAQQLPLLPEGAPLRPAMQATLDALLASGLETGAALRLLRQLVLERLVVLDCDVAPTLPTACGSLPPEGAGPPAVRQSRFRGRCLHGRGTALPAVRSGFFSGKIK